MSLRGLPPTVYPAMMNSFVDAHLCHAAERLSAGLAGMLKLRVRGQSIAGLVDPLVEQHIERHGLYTAAAGHERADPLGVDVSAGNVHGKS